MKKRINLIIMYGLLSLSVISVTSSYAYANNNKDKLKKIFVEFAESALLEVSKNSSKKTAKTAKIVIQQQNNNINDFSEIRTILLETVLAWDEAVSRRDTEALSDLYAYKVLYYGSKLSDRKCILNKKRFYKRYPLFNQRINNIKIEEIEPSLYKVSFTKIVKYTDTKKNKKYPSYLLLDISFSSPLILVEGDRITDRNLLKKYSHNK